MKEINDDKLTSTYLERNPSLKERDVATILLNCSACRFVAMVTLSSFDGNGKQEQYRLEDSIHRHRLFPSTVFPVVVEARYYVERALQRSTRISPFRPASTWLARLRRWLFPFLERCLCLKGSASPTRLNLSHGQRRMCSVARASSCIT